ncbi:DUF1800 domain-containing protein [Dehalococcoidia bacterium]|nr:DUF1800 domain-containing protein [Dehalococcoidia bacterium]
MANNNDTLLMAHLMRRAGFGASRIELDALVEQGYDETVDHIIDAKPENPVSDYMIRRYQPDHGSLMGSTTNGSNWLYRMIWSDVAFQEKIALFWHGIFATGYSKLANGKVLHDQIKMFAKHGLGSFENLLVEISRDPAMIVWLDNCESHKGAINENYGRELLELFSMGTGNYTEQDIKEASRAFTGWTIANTEYMTLKSQRDSIWPYGRLSFHFEYDPDDHDDGEKTFLGRTGKFNGEDIVKIICEQKATANFISRHMYSFFVADEPPVPEWPYKEPNDSAAIDALSSVYFDSGFDIKEMLRFLFKSDFFKSEKVWNKRVKSPVELVAGALRLTKEFDRPSREEYFTCLRTSYMGQWLMHPPSVEGWHWGTEWLDSGTLVERVNFSSSSLGNLKSAGVKNIAENIRKSIKAPFKPEQVIDLALDQLGALIVSDNTRSNLVEYAESNFKSIDDDSKIADISNEDVGEVLKLVGAMPEFQRA